MELRARAKRDRTRFHELKSVRKEGGHSRAVPRREAGKHVREEGRNRRWTSSEGGQPGDNHWIAGGGVRTVIKKEYSFTRIDTHVLRVY